jgi:hypothetical protein
MKLIPIIKSGLTAILLTSIVVFSFQCKKEANGGNSQPYSVNKVASLTPPAPITSTVQGNVVDENGLAAVGVSITVGTTIITTDSTGYFRINNAALDKKSSLVTAQKAGYFKAYRTFSATAGTNQVFIKLIKKTLTGTITSSAGGTVSISNGGQVLLPANGIIQASNNTSYSGTVNVYIKYIDPTDVDINKIIPGSFMADDKDGKRVLLRSYGMLEVELESSTGEKLQIAGGSTATITTPIPSALQSSAPATISLWYVDDQTGLWQEEGTATKSGTNYIGTVKHFTDWNCDYSAPNSVMFTATFKSPSGDPLVNTEVMVKTSGSDWGAHGFTDSHGQVSGLVAGDTALVVELFDECGNVIFSKPVTAQSADFDLGTITATIPPINLLTITGKLVDCSNTSVANGVATIIYNNIVQQVTGDTAGNFSLTIVQCSSGGDVLISGLDNNTHQSGNLTTFSLVSNTLDAGNIVACGNLLPFNVVIQGKLIDCSNAVVTSGYASVIYNGTTTVVPCDNSGNFSTTILYNSDSVHTCQITGIDANALQQGTAATITLNSIIVGNIANVGNIVACGSFVTSSISYTIDGSNHVLLDPISSLTAYTNTVIDSSVTPSVTNQIVSINSYCAVLNNQIQFFFTDNTLSTGTFPVNYLYLYGYDGGITLVQPFNVTLTNYPNVGEKYEGSFSGQFIDASNITHSVSCTFNQIRTN